MGRCSNVAIAERKRIEFWAGDQRLFNALHGAFPLVRWIGDYRPLRPPS
jgi:predicted nucleic acid-binding protein